VVGKSRRNRSLFVLTTEAAMSKRSRRVKISPPDRFTHGNPRFFVKNRSISSAVISFSTFRFQMLHIWQRQSQR
jgi:hypothetical protein